VAAVVEQRGRSSARRLGVEQIDLYQVHWPNPVVPIRATMSALAGLQRDGAVRHVGVSNFSLRRWTEAERSLLGPVATNQVRYSLVDRSPERDLLPWAQANDRIVMAYSPLGQGLLSGRYDEDHPPRGLRASTPVFLPENLRRAAPLLAVLREVAGTHRVSSAQVALAWLVRRPNVVVIPGASSLEQAVSNAEAAQIELGDDEDAALTAASDAYDPVRGLAVVPAGLRLRAGRVVRRVRRTAEGLRA
jgi:aryl-alcohol dehydrogenase-like predicted oxidoreductase